MDKTVNNFWKIRMARLKEALEENNFGVYLAENLREAADLTQTKILPELNAKSLSWGGSMTFKGSGLYERLRDSSQYEILDTYDRSVSPEVTLERRRQALLSDVFFTGTNAVTESGQLVNLDMIGNRVGAIVFGPKHVVVLAGRNKIVGDIHEAMVRVKDFSSPANVMRLGKNTPCAKTSVCQECKSPDRICNVWTITEKSYPKKRIRIVLINEDLGL